MANSRKKKIQERKKLAKMESNIPGGGGSKSRNKPELLNKRKNIGEGKKRGNHG